MQMSATLKIGQWGSFKKSMTCPWKAPGSRTIRSVRFPRMPAIKKPRPAPQARLPTLRANHSTTSAATMATLVSTGVNSVPVLKAAPGLNVRRNCSTSPMKRTSSRPSSFSRAIALVTWSVA